MLFRVVLLCQFLTAFIVCGGYDENFGKSITCVCSTTHCVEHRMQWCNTTGVCFSQYLDRRDGSHPVVRGCISSRTPLLCENRRPAVAPGGAWPLLVCCSTNLCNRDVVPTTSPSSSLATLEEMHSEVRHSQNEENDGFGQKHSDLLMKHPSADSELESKAMDPDPPDQEIKLSSSQKKSQKRSGSLPHIISPVYISVLVLGVVSLVIIGIVAAIVLRRNNRLYAEQYGSLGRHDECCFKVPHEIARLDEIEPCFHPRPYIQVVCSSKVQQSH